MKKRTRNKKLSFGLHGSFASFFDDVANGIGRLFSFGDPSISFIYVYRVVDTLFHRVVGADLLNVTAITAFAAVNGNDLVKGSIFSALAVESESKHDKSGVKNTLSLCGGAGNCTMESNLPSEK